MFPTLQAKLAQFEDLERQLQDPAVLADSQKLTQLQRERGGLLKVAGQVREFNRLEADVATAREMAEHETDPETKAYAEEELQGLQTALATLQAELEDMVLAGDALTRGSLIMEIRAGTGGDEAALFAGDLFNMYQKYAEAQDWKIEVMEFTPSDLGGRAGSDIFRER